MHQLSRFKFSVDSGWILQNKCPLIIAKSLRSILNCGKIMRRGSYLLGIINNCIMPVFIFVEDWEFTCASGQAVLSWVFKGTFFLFFSNFCHLFKRQIKLNISCQAWCGLFLGGIKASAEHGETARRCTAHIRLAWYIFNPRTKAVTSQNTRGRNCYPSVWECVIRHWSVRSGFFARAYSRARVMNSRKILEVGDYY